MKSLNGKWAFTQTQANKPKKLFLVEKLIKFLFLCYILITALSCKIHIKTLLYISWYSISFLRTFESNYYKVNQTVELLQNFQKKLPKPVLIIINEVLARPHLLSGNVMYDEDYNETFHQKLSVQYNACLALSGAIRGLSRQKPFQELSLQSLQICCWHKKFCLLHKF